MKWDDVSDGACPVARAAVIIGDRWTLLIVREALLGARNFSEFERQLRISPHLLSLRLARLVDEEILARVEDDYVLSPAGRDLWTVIAMVSAWGDRWRASPGGPDARQVHRHCSHAFSPKITCSECGDRVSQRDMKVEFSPALAAERAQRADGARRKKKSSA